MTVADFLSKPGMLGLSALFILAALTIVFRR